MIRHFIAFLYLLLGLVQSLCTRAADASRKAADDAWKTADDLRESARGYDMKGNELSSDAIRAEYLARKIGTLID